ncbi:MAG: NAD-dependent epimerase/dehydratase family protein [Planctomycetota bacterium]|nr:MAG: NAD-dependent epimerase/dehydratase family protein [Planctomycetota bacterium]
MSTKKILVTGATGFLGGALARRLSREGAPLRVFVRRITPAVEALDAEIVVGDLRDPESLAQATTGVETIHHTAALPGIWGKWRDYYETNTLGTIRLLEAARRAGVRRFIFTSSPSVTFDGSPQECVDESAPYPKRWLAHYPRSKALAEQAVLAQHGQDGLATCALRPHLIWGPGDRHLIPRLIARAKSGRLRRVGDGTNLIDNVYIDNAVEAQLAADRALEERPAEVGGRAFFISQGRPVRCWQWIDEILGIAGVPAITKSISFPAAYRIGYVCELIFQLLPKHIEPPMTRFLALQLAQPHYFDISKARELLGYQPVVSHEEGMQRLAEWLHDG